MTQTLDMKTIEWKLQKADRKQSYLYLFCNFTALMIISAYSALMLSSTVQTVFPQGGDSRKQMYAIFVMTLIGCMVFTMYALGLFFRHKSGQLGILMALGASRRRLMPGLFREVLFLSGLSAVVGIIAGFPFVWIIWRIFRLVLADSSEMMLSFDYRCLFVSLLFLLFVVGFACLTAWRYLKKTNIMEVIREEHINEPVKELGKWCGPAGFALILAGAAAGYSAPYLFQTYFSMYPPSWSGILYAPVLPGLYLVMLHTVVHGWKSRRRNTYKNIISRGMMKFQGKQTVNNMIVVAILIAGACFAIFYIPTVGVSALYGSSKYPCDYFFQYRADQNIPGREAVERLAGQYGLSLKDWGECAYISLGMGSAEEVYEDDGLHYHIEYAPISHEAKILSEEAYYALTGQRADVKPGTYLYVTDQNEASPYANETAKDLTNMVTREQSDTEFAGYAHYDFLSGDISYCVLDNADYDRMAEGLTDEWKGRIVQFNIDGQDSYQFAKELYRLLVSSFDASCEHISAYDRVSKIAAEEAGKSYWGDTDSMTKISYEEADSLAFQSWWAYRPTFRILVTNDYLQSAAVLFMMFLFIFIVCLTAALVICHTRCQTIALNNRYIFDDLKKLGASPRFLSKEVRSQCNNVFKVPALVGMCSMYILYSLILYANDGRILINEAYGLLTCFALLVVIGAVVWAVWRGSVAAIERQLGINPSHPYPVLHSHGALLHEVL